MNYSQYLPPPATPKPSVPAYVPIMFVVLSILIIGTLVVAILGVAYDTTQFECAALNISSGSTLSSNLIDRCVIPQTNLSGTFTLPKLANGQHIEFFTTGPSTFTVQTAQGNTGGAWTFTVTNNAIVNFYVPVQGNTTPGVEYWYKETD